MATKQKLERTISSTQDMSSIVRTMKSLAAVNVRVFGQAREAIEEYMTTLEYGLQVAIGGNGGLTTGASRVEHDFALFVFGAVQGMCGQFSDHVARKAADYARRTPSAGHVVAVGPRVGSRLADRGISVDRNVEMSGSLDVLPRVVDECIVAVQQLHRRAVQGVIVFYNAASGRSSYEPHEELVLPVSEAWLDRITRRSWPTRALPSVVTDRASLLTALARQYLFASFYRAAAQSLASENAARLASMQSAESNIDERLGELRAAYNRQRQQEITSELLDIVGGYTALE